jgi:hypothetical protein
MKFSPVYIRIPKPGENCVHTGLTRGIYFNLIKAGKIKTVNVTSGTKKRGCRLLELQSVLDYIKSCDNGGNHEGTTA